MTHPTTTLANTLIPAAYLTQPHGLKGQIKAKVLLQNPQLLIGSRPTSQAALTIHVLHVQPLPNNGAILTLQGIANRTDAESLKGLTLYIAREELPALAEGEVYLADLIGRAVVSPLGQVAGHVTALQAVPGQDLLVVSKPDGKTALIPPQPEYLISLTTSPLQLTELGESLLQL